jgi:hypothetical protein
MCIKFSRVPDPHQFYADSDPTFHFFAAPDPDPANPQRDASLRPLTTEHPGLHFEPLPYASIVSIHGPPQLHFKPLKLLNSC